MCRNSRSAGHDTRSPWIPPGDRGREAAQAFFRKAVSTQDSQWPRTVNLDGNMASHLAMRLLGEEDPRWQAVTVRDRRYLNNIVEQDHRAIKRRCAAMLGFKSFRTLDGIELAVSSWSAVAGLLPALKTP